MSRRIILTLTVLFFLGSMGESTAADAESNRQSLAGLTGVEVVVENLEPEFERLGLTHATLQTDVELKLRLAGIKVLTSKENALTPAVAFLYVKADMLSGPGGLWIYSVSVELHQAVKLARNTASGSSRTLYATTWGSFELGGVGTSNPQAVTVRDQIKEQVDKFVNAYLSVNPRN